MKFVENAVQFEPDSSIVRVKYRLSVDGIAGVVDLHSVLDSMEVSAPIISSFLFV